MNETHVTVDQWVGMFRAVGLDDEQMEAWHGVFEHNHPDAHESFLRWLDLPADRIVDIRGRAGARA